MIAEFFGHEGRSRWGEAGRGPKETTRRPIFKSDDDNGVAGGGRSCRWWRVCFLICFAGVWRALKWDQAPVERPALSVKITSEQPVAMCDSSYSTPFTNPVTIRGSRVSFLYHGRVSERKSKSGVRLVPSKIIQAELIWQYHARRSRIQILEPDPRPG